MQYALTTPTRRPMATWIAAASAALLLVVGGATVRPARAEDRRPNVVFILTDDQRWDTMSCAGSTALVTPNLDRLAEQGARFANAFATTSLCSPSRASFLSGKYAHGHGVINNFTDFPKDLPSFPRRLKEAGYTTAYIGKWHMGEDDDSPRPGFDHWVSHRGQGDYFDTEFNVDGTRQVLSGYYTTVVTDLAVDYLESVADDNRPFCLIVGHKAPHTPYTPEPKYAHRFDHLTPGYPRSAFDLAGKPEWVKQRLDTWHGIYGPIYGFRPEFPDRSAAGVVAFDNFVRGYFGTILSIDESVGRIVRALDEHGVLDDTIVVFAGDNGMFLGEHGMTDKRAMHEPSIRIPFLMRYPKRIRPGTVVDELVLNIDLAPTLVELCGASPLENIHGRSMVPLFDGDPPTGDGRSSTSTTMRSSFPTRRTFAGSAPRTGPTCITPTATAPPTAIRPSSTTSPPTQTSFAT